MNESEILEQIKLWITQNGLNIIVAIIILIVGRWVAALCKGIVKKILNKRSVEHTIISFLGSLTFALVMVFTAIAALSQAGINTGSFIAVLGAAGLAIGLALQGTLSNFAAGFLMLIFRPFKKGDYVEAAGIAGIVEDVHIFTTVFKTPDNKQIIVPNGKIMGDNIVNYSATGTRRIEIIIGISYEDSIDEARKVLLNIVKGDDRILGDPEPVVVLKELGDSSVNLAIRVWVNTADYWDVFFQTTEAAKKQIEAAGLTIPFPQRDVHMIPEK